MAALTLGIIFLVSIAGNVLFVTMIIRGVGRHG